MFKSFAFTTAAALAFTVHVAAQNPDPAQAPQPEQPQPASQQQQQSMQQASAAVQAPEFVKTAGQNHKAEIELAQLAQSKAQNPQVKQYAQTLANDHQAANQQVTQIAQKLNVEIPSEFTAAQTSTKDRLQGLSGAEFDKVYIDTMVENHQKGIETYRTATELAQEDVRIYAESTLPALRTHLEQAQQIQETLAAGDSQPAAEPRPEANPAPASQPTPAPEQR
jgi:putative membrane protein